LATNELGLTVAMHDKEILILRDDDRWLLIRCGCGANPPLASLQPVGLWDEVMPDWQFLVGGDVDGGPVKKSMTAS
jgi:hypothetical protein